MTIDINHIVISGNIVSDIILKDTRAGGLLASFLFASTGGTSKNQKKMFISMVAYDKDAEYLHKSCKKGSNIIFQGRLRMNAWIDKNGTQKIKHEIAITNIFNPKYNAPPVPDRGEKYTRFDESDLGKEPETREPVIAEQPEKIQKKYDMFYWDNDMEEQE